MQLRQYIVKKALRPRYWEFALLAMALTCAAGAAGTGGSPGAPPEAGRASLGTVATVLSEDFEFWPPPGWVLSADPQTGGVWKSLAHQAGCSSGSSFPYSNATGGAGLCADANSDCLGDGMDTTMVTPAFSLASPDYLSAQLQFKSDFFCAAALDEAWVDITTDGGAVWTNLLYFDRQSVRGPDTETIDLTPYLGQPDVRLSFEYAAPGWDWYWQVDDVAVTAVQQEPCTITCTATVPAFANPGTPVSFAATAAPSAVCTGTPSFAWTFGDGQTSAEQNPSHAYASAGSYDWSVTADADGVPCSRNGTVIVVSPPAVSLVKKAAPPFRIVVTGSNLQRGMAVSIDGAAWTSVVWKNTTKVVLKGALKSAIPKGVPRTFRFVNPDGGETVMTWSW